MPTPPSPWAATRMSRRTTVTTGLVGGLAMPLLAGCTGDVSRPLPGTPTAGPDPDEQLAVAAADGERQLVDQARRTVELHPQLRRFLAGAISVHRAHLHLLGSDPLTTSPGTPDAAPSAVPHRPEQAVVSLRRRERSLAAAHTARAVAASSGTLARVFAAMAAAAAQQDHELARARIPPGGGRR